MLLTLSVTNFKSIRNTETLSLVGSSLDGPHEPFDVVYPGGQHGVLPCAVIYGANASGKSNMLDAFMHLRSLVLNSHLSSKRSKGLRYQPFMLDPESTKNDTELEVSFIQGGIRYDYGLSHDAESIKTEWLYSYPEGRRRKLFEREGLVVDFGSGMKGAKKVLSSFLNETSLFLSVATQNSHQNLSAVSGFFVDIFSFNRISVASGVINRSFSDGEVDPRAIHFLEGVGSGVCDFRVDATDMSEDQKKVIEDLFKVIASHQGLDSSDDAPELSDKEYEVRLGHRSGFGPPVFFQGNQESAGTRRLLYMMNYIFEVLDKGDIAIIDEIDASLHTFAVEAILTLFLDERINKNGAQIIATTHDTNLLDPSRLRRDEIWFVEKNVEGSSEYFSLSEINARKEEAVEKAYLQGRYGATPPKLPAEYFLPRKTLS